MSTSYLPGTALRLGKHCLIGSLINYQLSVQVLLWPHYT